MSKEKKRHPHPLLNWLTNKMTAWLMQTRPSYKTPSCDFERLQYEIRPCDIILIEGQTRVSELIKLSSQSPWSHAAIYIGRLHDVENPVLRERVAEHYDGKEDEQLLIESILGEGTIVTTLSHYKDQHLRICRPQGIIGKDAQKVVAYTIASLGMEYDVRQIFDLGRLFFPWFILPRRWRSTLFQRSKGTSTKQICSTMIAEAFQSISFPVLPQLKKNEDNKLQLIARNPRLYTPSDFDYSPYFEIIKYPMYGLTQTMYRDLPWNKELLSNDSAELSYRAKPESPPVKKNGKT